MTMLTLFKPWRTGKDLRPNLETTWSDVFNQHQFTDRQLEIMKFFHIRYECNDARDDFSAKRSKEGEAIKTLFDMSTSQLNDIDTQHHWNDSDVPIPNKENDIINSQDWNMTSEAELTRKSNVQQANNIMQHSGWLDALPEREAVTKATRLTFNEDKTGGDWRNVLNEERQKVLEAREAEASQKKNGTKGKGAINNEVNEVKVIDKRYLMSNKFRASNAAAQKLIDDTVLEFSLNEAQERAFRIVANHAVEPNGEHLKMYLGGMAGTGKSQVIKALTHFFAERGESYRFMSSALTGSAAALIGGLLTIQYLGLDKRKPLNLLHP